MKWSQWMPHQQCCFAMIIVLQCRLAVFMFLRHAVVFSLQLWTTNIYSATSSSSFTYYHHCHCHRTSNFHQVCVKLSTAADNVAPPSNCCSMLCSNWSMYPAHWAHSSKLAAVGPQSFLQPMTFTMLCRLSNSRNTHEVRLFITHDDNGMRKTDMCIKLTWIITLINYKTASIINSWNVMEQQEIWIHWIHWTLTTHNAKNPQQNWLNINMPHKFNKKYEFKVVLQIIP